MGHRAHRGGALRRAVPRPGRAKVDITIDGDLTVGHDYAATGSKSVTTEFSPKNDTNEDTIGGLVVRNAKTGNGDNNNPKRQQITVRKLVDADGDPVVGGQVKLTVPGQVTLFDKATGGKRYRPARSIT